MTVQQKEATRPEIAELTMRETADRLDVSQSFLIGLLGHGEGQIPYRGLGSRRRIKLSDLEAYCLKIEQKREAAMQELADQAQELGLGY